MIGNYVVAYTKGRGSPLALGKVKSKAKGVLTVLSEKDCHIKTRQSFFEVLPENVVLDLGTDPVPGVVYGHDTHLLYRGSKMHDYFGKVCFFYKPDKEVGQKIWAAFDRAYKILAKHGIDFADSCIWEIHPAHKGKWAGFYKRSPKPEVMPHRFSIKPEKMLASEYVYVILHEVAHHLHMNYLESVKLNSLWIKAFNTSIKTDPIDKATSTRLFEALMGGEDRPSDFKTNLSEEDTLAYKWILRVIKENHNLGIKELNTLFEADREEIQQVWPLRSIPKKELKPIVSEYATTHVNELIAEAFAFYLTGKELPPSLVRLVEKSISLIKAKL